MLDYGVNSGISRPIHVARAILLGSSGSGVMDNTLLTALQKANVNSFIDRMSAERLQFMHAIRGGSAWAEFGGGWGARVSDLRAYSHHLDGRGAVPVAPDLSKVETPKAKHGSPHTVKNVIKSTTGTVIPAGTAAHYGGIPPELLALGLGFVIVGGVAFVLWKKQHDSNLNASVILPPAPAPIIVPAAVAPVAVAPIPTVAVAPIVPPVAVPIPPAAPPAA
jgi:lysozyme family protein